MNNIIVPIDFSGITKKIVEEAIVRAKAFSSKIYLIHVSNKDDFVFEIKMKEIVKWIKESGVEVQTVLEQGQITKVILEQVDMKNADLIIIGSHGHTAAYIDMFGSVTETILKEAKCPVLVIPARYVIENSEEQFTKV